jgi:hypothetical protein
MTRRLVAVLLAALSLGACSAATRADFRAQARSATATLAAPYEHVYYCVSDVLGPFSDTRPGQYAHRDVMGWFAVVEIRAASPTTTTVTVARTKGSVSADLATIQEQCR